MTILDICNLALSSLGHDRRVSDLAAQTKEACLCSLWIDTARRNVLGAAFWNGLTRASGPFDGAPDGEGRFRYPRPCGADALKTEAVDALGRPADILAADRDGLTLEIPRASFRVMPDADDPEDWPHDVRAAVAAELAALIAYPLTGQRGVAADARDAARGALSRARAANANLTRRHGEQNRYAAARSAEGWS